VYRDFVAHQHEYGDTSVLPTPVFFYGQQPGEEIAVDIEPGKTLIIKYLTYSEPHADGKRTVFFELNGQPREVSLLDRALEPQQRAIPKADPDDPTHVAAGMPGMVVTVAVRAGDNVAQGQKLLTLEAMKMETTISAPRDGKVGRILVQPGSTVETGDLLLTVE
jgi:pyruvate carboxylase